jgi:UDP-N-acetylglucosamine:LPS N-acetylglucosamine transferase
MITSSPTPDTRPSKQHDRVELLLVCTGGGHLLQLWSLRAAWSGYKHAWVVEKLESGDAESLLRDERVYFAHSPATRSIKHLLRNLILAWRLIGRLQPDVVLTTGAAVAVPFAWVARLRRIRVAYVESLARASTPSLSCRLVAPVADRVYVQWPELLATLRKARYVGKVFAER